MAKRRASGLSISVSKEVAMNYTVGGRVLLRPVEIKDDEYIVRWRNTERQAFFTQTVVTPDTHVDFVTNRRAHDLIWMVESHPWKTVGMVSLTVDVVNATAEFGRLFVAQGFRRQRLGKEITNTVLAYAFEILRLKSVYLLVKVDNTIAKQLYNEMGWSTELSQLDRTRMVYTMTAWAMQGRQRFMDEFGVNLDPNTDLI